MTQEEKEEIIDAVFEKTKNYIKEHLNIEVEGYYEPYSGQSEHWHHVNLDFH